MGEIKSLLRANRDESSDLEAFVESNSFTTFIVMNTWILLANDIQGIELAGNIRELVQSRGPQGAIAYCQAIASEVVSLANKDSATFTDIASSMLKCNMFDCDLGKILQVLRYPKRYTVVSSPTMEIASIQSFLDANLSCKGFTCSTYLRTSFKECVHDMLRTYCDSPKIMDCNLSGGSTTVGREMSKKVSSLFDYLPSYGYYTGHDPNCEYGTALNAFQYNWDIKSCNFSLKEFYGCDKVVSVPKNYKTYRIVSPQRPIESYLSEGLRCAIASALKDDPCISYKDQSLSRETAFKASITGEYATIDLSQASDRIPYDFVTDIFPYSIAKWFPYTTCRNFMLRGYDVKRGIVTKSKNAKKILTFPYYMFGSMGSRLTYIVECIVFAAAAHVAADIARIDDPLPPVIVGDDMEVDVRIVDTLFDVLRSINAIPSVEKSFYTGNYREACGAEYYHGYDVRTQYCPRKSLDIRKEHLNETLSSLISLEHRLFEFPSVRLFLTKEIRRLFPRMTSSSFGSPYDDLWEVFPLSPKANHMKILPTALRDKLEGNGLVMTTQGQMSGADLIPYFEYEKHYTLTTSYKLARNIKYSPDFERWTYMQYLKHGPSYDDPLSELLHVSTPRLSAENYATFLGKTESKYMVTFR
jgi:hypothetical protein